MSYGRVLPERSVPSKFLGAPRTIRVYLPPSYDQASTRRYPVLYVHDGQNVFSYAGDFCCFGWGNWGLDRTLDELIAAQRIQEVILVAVDNSRNRYSEYCGLNSDSSVGRTNTVTRFESYRSFLTKELKPYIDKQFRTRREARHTALMGSSLGGLCSLAIAWEHPRTFGLAASLSGSFQVEKKYFLRQVLKPYTKRTKSLRVYLDSGVIDYTGDDDGRRDTAAVAAELRRIGWKDGENLEHYVETKILTDSEMQSAGLRPEKWGEARTNQHNEFFWRIREYVASH